ncbi:unnamed protein product [Protopolystoma xenopodis]|uniref:Uncharacterized protein n=1 Tax=Protopolystoma xenopodis TaxID=117903 RepID=A0A448X349_9PLAT|nr:unnamed protein product [Protopolystoma xenopodis]
MQAQSKLAHHLSKQLPGIFPTSASVPTAQLHAILVNLTARQYSLHTSAAQAYATYLTLAGHLSNSAEDATDAENSTLAGRHFTETASPVNTMIGESPASDYQLIIHVQPIEKSYFLSLLELSYLINTYSMSSAYFT